MKGIWADGREGKEKEKRRGEERGRGKEDGQGRGKGFSPTEYSTLTCPLPVCVTLPCRIITRTPP